MTKITPTDQWRLALAKCPDWLTVSECAALADVHRNIIINAIERGELVWKNPLAGVPNGKVKGGKAAMSRKKQIAIFKDSLCIYLGTKQ